jgi:hypothetical protein
MVHNSVSFQDESALTATMYHVIDATEKALFSPKLPLQGRQQGGLSSDSISQSEAESPWENPEWSATWNKVPKLEDYREATLLRYFKRILGPWVRQSLSGVLLLHLLTPHLQLDGGEHGGHFTVTVVELATSCQLLLYACLALSARHLSNTTTSMPAEVAEDYHGRCISILLPTLANEEFRTNLDTLLAATVILRLFEQISCTCHPLLYLSFMDWR